MPFSNGKPSGGPHDILTGALDGGGKEMGRSVGVAMDRTGALMVADNMDNKVWRVVPDGKAP